MSKKRLKLVRMGFKQAFQYVLDLLCYAYYVKHDNLVSDQVFDGLERLYMNIFKENTAPMRGIELEHLYSRGVQVTYDWLKKDKK